MTITSHSGKNDGTDREHLQWAQRDARHLELIESIYEGTQEANPWEGALKLLRQALGASWIALLLRPATSTQAALVVTAGGVVSLPAESPYANINEIPPGGVFREVPPGLARQICAPGEHASQHVVGADLLVTSAFRARLRIARSGKAGAFTVGEIQFVQALLPHFTRAMRDYEGSVSSSVELRLLRGAVESLGLGVAILGEAGEILQLNRCAELMLQERKGISAVCGMIRCNSPTENKRLWGAIRMALAQRFDAGRVAYSAVAASYDEDRFCLSMLVRPISPGPFSCGGKAPAVALYIRHSNQEREIQPNIIGEVFGLTRTESALTLELVKGLSMDEAAAVLHIRRNTARTHLRSIFSKTGVRRQTELMRVVLSSVATMV